MIELNNEQSMNEQMNEQKYIFLIHNTSSGST